MAEEKPRLEFGRVAGLIFGGLGANITVFLLLGTIFVLVPGVLLALVWVTLLSSDPAAESGMNLVSNLLSVFASLGVMAALHRGWTGQSCSLAEAMAVARGRFWPVIITNILWGLGILLGLVALLVPGIILSMMWCLAEPVATLERWKGPRNALGRSRSLTKGHRWKIFLISLACGAALFVLVMIVAFLGVAIGALMGLHNFYDVVVGPVIEAVLSVFLAAMLAAIYHELVRIKEGGGATVAAVFD
ncbi:MAG: hypothetical protein JWM33_3348 [Caulobacteraceae bacterium]|nr:hypothetical protein [Caulobacteraceae bacterium]